MTRRLLLVLLFILAAGSRGAAQSRPTLVILVRHAEKAAAPAADPPLTDAGIARANALAAALVHANVQAIVTTELLRTRETARPYAEAHGLAAEIVHSGPRAAHAKAVARAVLAHAGQVVLVVGHSDTIPAIIAALGGPELPDICNTQYSNFFVLYLDGTSTRLVQSSYGAPSPDPAATCRTTTK